MSMKRKQDPILEEMNIGAKLACGCLAALIAVLAVLGVTLYLNKEAVFGKRPVSSKAVSSNKVAAAEPDEDFTIEKSTLTSDDLDFWDMYDDREEEEKFPSNQISTVSKNIISRNRVSVDYVSDNSISGNTASGNEVSSNEVSENKILDGIPKNSYKKDSFRKENGKLEYYKNNAKISSIGIDVSKYQGDIDWQKVKDAGIEFAMIRMGVRGYNSGKVVMDEDYIKNMTEASAQGISLGIYFYSQAVSREEAVEEANYAVVAAQSFGVSYPIVFYTEHIENDAARTDHLTPKTLSECAKAFCDTVKGYGYIPMIMGNKEHFMENMELTDIVEYDWWLSDITDFSDFPYKYSMWQYANNGKVDGISGNVNLNISFVDYAYR